MKLKPWTYVVQYTNPRNTQQIFWVDGTFPLAALAELERQLNEVYVWVEYVRNNVMLYFVDADNELFYMGNFSKELR